MTPVCACMYLSEYAHSTLHLCSSIRPSYLCGNVQIYPGFIDFDNVYKNALCCSHVCVCVCVCVCVRM